MNSDGGADSGFIRFRRLVQATDRSDSIEVDCLSSCRRDPPHVAITSMGAYS